LNFEFVQADPIFSAFKRVVRDLEFDVAELSLVTYLQAKAYDKPLVLLPAVMFSRFQHPYLVYNSKNGALSPHELAGKCVGVRLYTSTTGTWLRGILDSQYGINPDAIKWMVFDDPHLAEFHDPSNVQKAKSGDTLMDLLYRGEIDAAIVDPIPADLRVRPVIANPADAARDWQAKYHAIQINHMVVVSKEMTRKHPLAVRDIYAALLESKRSSGIANGGPMDTVPFGVEANRKNLEVAIDYVHRQGLIPRKYRVEELFDEVTGAFA
jgi:4,5-dihydroxyphthalate decarboxylase